MTRKDYRAICEALKASRPKPRPKGQSTAASRAARMAWNLTMCHIGAVLERSRVPRFNWDSYKIHVGLED